MKFCLLFILLLTIEVPHSTAQTISQEQRRFLQKNSTVVCSSDLINTNWNVPLHKLKDSRLILLGEFTHGSKEIFQLRNSLIQYLHQQMGVRTILFESGIGEIISAEINKATMSPAQMINGLIGGWRTKEFIELMDYVKLNNLSIAGFDVQRTGGSFFFLLKKLAGSKNIDSSFYQHVEQQYGQITKELSSNKATYDSVKSRSDQLIAAYQLLLDKLSPYTLTDPSKELLLCLATITNRVRYLRYMLTFTQDKNWNKRWAARDSAMADNIEWLLENIYKNEPVVIIGHNYHVAKFNQQEITMGELLHKKYGPKMYALGMYAGTGSYLDNFGKEVQLLPTDTGQLDIKNIIHNNEGLVNYIHIPKKKLKGRDWLDKEIIINDTFIDLNNSNKLILSKSFDGLLLIKKTSAPIMN